MIKVAYIISDIDKALAFEWIAEGLSKSKFSLSFILIVQKPAQLEQFLIEKGVPCHVFYYRSKQDFPKILWKVFSLLKRTKPDLIHCHLLYGSLIGLTAAMMAGVKKRYYTRHHSDFHHRYFPKGIKWDKWCNRIATKIVAPSASVKEVLMNYEKVEEGKIVVIHHGFDLSYFTEKDEARVNALKAKYQTHGYYPVVGVIARFTELKGIQYIIPAFHQLLKQYPEALILLFNARGDYEQAIKQQLRQLIPEANYRLIAFENDLGSVYHILDLFIQVSTDRNIEAFGQTYVEALAAGVPSVFTLSGIANDFIRNKYNALVVPFKKTDAIYNAMSEILKDKALRENITRYGRESVQEKFNLRIMIQKLEILYEQE